VLQILLTSLIFIFSKKMPENTPYVLFFRFLTQKMEATRRKILIIIAISWCFTMMTSCKKLLDVALPTDKFDVDGAYQNDSSAGAVITGIISTAASSPVYGSAFTFDGLGFSTSLYADDLKLIQATLITGTAATKLYYTNSLTSANGVHWTTLYKQIYSCNLAIENLEKNKKKLSLYNQWMGEVLFLRAFSYFDLINLYGEVPLALVSDYNVNNVLGRSAKAVVYAQVVADLKQAELLLGTTYLDGKGMLTGNRVRPNQFAAAALLARVYLYMGDYKNTEKQATKVIANSGLYELSALNAVFLANSKETIWALVPEASTTVQDYFFYNNGVSGVAANQAALSLLLPAAMSQGLVESFEAGDLRLTNWITLRTTTSAPVNGKFYFPNKYKSRTNGEEFNVMMRLAEQYLIRAESRAMQGNIGGAVEDLNLIRKRARNSAVPGALADYSTTLTQQECTEAIFNERRRELFTEQGHRFYDLKRSGKIDSVMAVYAASKEATWASYKQWWPIPANDVQFNPNLTQTPGYN
jgi:hypothetical protein